MSYKAAPETRRHPADESEDEEAARTRTEEVDEAKEDSRSSSRDEGDGSSVDSTSGRRELDFEPPLPDEVPPVEPVDDGWQPVWDDGSQAYYFYNRLTGITTWANPRVPESTATTTTTAMAAAPGVVVVVIDNEERAMREGEVTTSADEIEDHHRPQRTHKGYDPSIHGDYDPTADYAQEAPAEQEEETVYTAQGTFNRFTGKWQPTALTPDNFNDENKSRRQMNAFFDVDAAANSHDGKSLKAERSGKKLTKKELKAFKEKRREKKEEKRRAWLRD